MQSLSQGPGDYDLNRIPGVLQHGGFPIRKKGALGEAEKGGSREREVGRTFTECFKGLLRKVCSRHVDNCPLHIPMRPLGKNMPLVGAF